MKITKLYHGAAIYPELWDQDTLNEDIKEMKKVGINVVRIGEFLWSVLEKNEGEIDISPLEKMLDVFKEAGIDVILGTPTCTPPIWMSDGHEERLYVSDEGKKMIHGSRQHICTNNDYFRYRSHEITKAIAQAVGSHPALILWQIDNEFKSHQGECCCKRCKALWHQWLEKRYGSIEALNKAWGTLVWSERYQSFEQVPQPFKNTPFMHSASLLTMYQLFSRQKLAEYAHEEAAIIRKYSKVPITTNTGMSFALDNELLFSKLDVVSYDTYASIDHVGAYLINCDLARGLKKNEHFWLMETDTSHGGAIIKNPTPHPNGYLVCEAVAAYALGSASFNYWLWRGQPYGCELNHSAVLSAWGRPGVGYQNVLKVEAARKEIEPFILATECMQGDLAVTYSDVARVFMNTENHKNNNYRGLMTLLYEQVVKAGIHRDLTPEGASLKGYKMLLTPFMFYLSPEYIDRAKQFVESGGIWLVGPMTGGRTAAHTVTLDAGINKEVEEMAGIEVECSYPIDHTDAVGEAFGLSVPLSLWTHKFNVKDAKVIGVIKGGVMPDTPLICERKVGKGKIVMLASNPLATPEGGLFMQKLLQHYAKEAGIEILPDVAEGSMIIPRESKDGKQHYRVAVNMNGKGGNVKLEKQAYDVLGKCLVESGKAPIAPFGYRIFAMDK